MNFIENIKRLFYWIPVIWKDRDWDHYYFTKLLRHKLASMQKFYASDKAWCVDAEKISNQIKDCVVILDRIIEDDYNKTGWLRHDLTWGELNIERDEDDHIEFTRKYAYTDELKKVEKKRFMALSKEDDRLRKEDIKKVFELIGENLENWWD